VNRLRFGSALMGFVLAFLSVILNDVRLGWAAIAVLLVSAIIRLVQRKRVNENPGDQT
jgi:UDP-N-acetylmuramyl pentapeptide phosphotransferase/UDP-N-acetylglucosamine-1-phosphate transferase